MPKGTNQTEKNLPKSRSDATKPRQAECAVSRRPKINRPKKQFRGPFQKPASMKSRTIFAKTFAGSDLRSYDHLFLTTQLFALALEEAREFLSPTGVMMALAAIGMQDRTVKGYKLQTKIENLLLDAFEND